jgi:pimeloyl-ACP methyl ester carboxylesterase
MTGQAMQRTTINGVELEIRDRGSWEPVVFVHGGMGDECAAVLVEPALADQFRLIHYHRRGYGNSEAPKAPVRFHNRRRTAELSCNIWALNERTAPVSPAAASFSCRWR